MMALVLGDVELTDKALVLSVNSRARSDRGRALLSEVLGGMVGEPLVEMQPIGQLKRRGTALRRKCQICPKKIAALSFTAVWIGTIAICLTSRSRCSEISHHALRPEPRGVA